MAHKKGVGSSRNGRDRNPKMLGVKLYDGQAVKPGMIIVRQRGTKIRPGENVRLDSDDTIYALTHGLVKFSSFSRTQKKVSVIPVA